MNFDLDENQRLFQSTVERLTASRDVPERKQARAAPGGVDRQRWQEFAELGLIAAAAAEADGGLGGHLADCVVVANALGQGLAPEPWLECGFLPVRLLGGTDSIADVIAGHRLAAVAFAEPGRRYLLEPAKTVARAVGDGHVLSGEKTFVLAGGAADLFVVTARLSDRTALFEVPRDAKGVEVRPYPVADGGLACQLILRDVAVGQPIPDGTARWDEAVDAGRTVACAEIAGTARRVFDDTLAYTKTREQFGQPIGRFQAIQHRLVDMYAKFEQCQSTVYRMLLATSGRDAIAGLAAYCGEEATWVAEQCVQLHGGMGMTDELEIGHGLKRIILLSRLFGDPASGYANLARAA